MTVDWNRAVCRTHDPEIWYADDRQDLAVAWCYTCPVRLECLDRALRLPEKFGVWGGMTAEERKIINYRKHRVRCPSCRSLEVDDAITRVEVCRACGLSWRV